MQRRAVVVEGVNGRLKDESSGTFVHVRGAIEVKRHLVFDTLVLAVDQIFRLQAFGPPPA